ncbi:zinc metallopeptidase [bacterium]|nr:zinc metallopeptidase [bacterium]
MLILVFAIMAASWFVQHQLKSKFRKYSQTSLRNGMTGREVAEKMLADNGITDVQVISVNGQLTDHYNPAKKTVNLSTPVYNQANAAAAAVAAHECGHAVQHAKAYSWLTLRSKMVPMVNISSKWMQWVILGGFLLAATGGTLLVLQIGIALFAVTTIFSFVTLPVEYDASNRALAWIKERRIVTEDEYAMSKDALKWAARTYVVAALGSLATLLYYISLFTGRD